MSSQPGLDVMMGLSFFVLFASFVVEIGLRRGGVMLLGFHQDSTFPTRLPTPV
jgi:hypothetical protein